MLNERLALLVQLQPLTPWRCGAGEPEEPASLVPSDTLFGALTHAFGLLGWREEWLRDGAGAVRFTSLLPWQQDLFYAPLPLTLDRRAASKRLRLEAVRFAPFSAITSLAAQKFDESRWILDLASGCLLVSDRGGAGGPYRRLERRRAAVDRLTGAAVQAAATTGLDFGAQSGLWSLFVWPDEDQAKLWSPRLKGAFRLLADEGIGGWRAAGWGRSRRPRFRDGSFARLLEHMGWAVPAPETTSSWWTLGLYVPGESAEVDWAGGAYTTLVRAGWSPEGVRKPARRVVREGAVLYSQPEPAGLIERLESGLVRYGAALALPWNTDAGVLEPQSGEAR